MQKLLKLVSNLIKGKTSRPEKIQNSPGAVLTSAYRRKSKKLVAIEFGPTFVKVISAEPAWQGLRLVDYNLKGFASLEKDEAAIVEFVRNFMNTNSISEREVYLSISEAGKIIIKDVSLPVLPKEEILEAAKWQIKEDIPFSLEEAIFDYQIIKEFTDAEGAKKNRLILVLAEAKTISKYVSILEKCNLIPIRITCTPFNYANILRHQKKEEVPIQAVLDIGYSDTFLYIYNNKKPQFARNLPFSSEKLTRSLTGALLSDKGKIELSYEEAQQLKEVFGIPQDPSQMLKENLQAMQVISLMRPTLELLTRELKRSIDYFTANFNEEGPAVIYLTGEGGSLKNLDKYLSGELNISVSGLSLPDSIDTHKIKNQKFNKEQNLIMSALGALLCDQHTIDLLPLELKTRKIEFIQQSAIRVVGVVASAVFLFSFLMLQSSVHDYKKRLKNAQTQLQLVKEIKAVKDRLDLRENLIDRVQQARVPAGGLLKILSAMVPNEIILEELILNQEKHILTIKGSVSAWTKTAESVLTEFMKNLEASPFLTEATLLSSKKTAGIQIFEIKCDLVY